MIDVNEFESKQGALIYASLLAIHAPENRLEEAQALCEAIVETLTMEEVKKCTEIADILLKDKDVCDWAIAKWPRPMPPILTDLFGMTSGPQGSQEVSNGRD